MKIFLTFLITIFFFTPVAAASLCKIEELKFLGVVRTLEGYPIFSQMRDGKLTQIKEDSAILTLDREGNLIERIIYDKFGNITSKLTCTFDENGRNIGAEEYSPNIPQLIRNKYIYILDSNENLIEYKTLQNDALISAYTYKYDTQGNKIEENFYGNGEKVLARTIYTYDEIGNLTSETKYNGDQIYSKSISTYDEKGKRTEQLFYSDNKLRQKSVSKFDNQGRIIEEEFINFPNNYSLGSQPPEIGKIIHIYDEKKRTKQTAGYKPDGSLTNLGIFTYDKYGNEIGYEEFTPKVETKNAETKEYNDLGELRNQFQDVPHHKYKTEIEYDEQGNWTKKTSCFIKNGKWQCSPYTMVQIITYY